MVNRESSCSRRARDAVLPKEEEQYYGKVHEIRHESTDGYRWVQMGTDGYKRVQEGTRGYSMDGTRGYKRVQMHRRVQMAHTTTH